ncbi:MAG: PfkB family carbohydrate kinase [Cyanobacteria bacterium J06623_7]
MQYRGLFVGLTTLDFIYLSDRPLQPNQKAIAKDYLAVAGGPATNAAIAFGSFNNFSQLFSVVGQHPLSTLIKDDLKQHQIDSLDLMPAKIVSPPVSSIIVTATTGERALISLNAVKSQSSLEISSDCLDNIDLVLLDGHQLEVSLQVAAIAKNRKIPLVLDGGSWKPGLERLIPSIDYAICSANFYPPQCQQQPQDHQAVFNWLLTQGVNYIAITRGEQPIVYCESPFNNPIYGTIDIPPIQAIDTLGAGDIFHGAFCHYILQHNFNFAAALKLASDIASRSCLSFGTRSWMRKP